MGRGRLIDGSAGSKRAVRACFRHIEAELPERLAGGGKLDSLFRRAARIFSAECRAECSADLHLGTNGRRYRMKRRQKLFAGKLGSPRRAVGRRLAGRERCCALLLELIRDPRDFTLDQLEVPRKWRGRSFAPELLGFSKEGGDIHRHRLCRDRRSQDGCNRHCKCISAHRLHSRLFDPPHKRERRLREPEGARPPKPSAPVRGGVRRQASIAFPIVGSLPHSCQRRATADGRLAT